MSSTEGTGLKRLARNWNEWGRKDPLFAILVNEQKKHGKWCADEFFQTGRDEIQAAIAFVESLGVKMNFRSALDFGCGVGRLTQALADRFETCAGVDIAPSMIELANQYNRRRNRCQYFLNAADDLRLFDDAQFSFVYSNIVLQHMRPQLGRRYIVEFLRVLEAGGVALFQCPSERHRRSATAFGREVAKEACRGVLNAGSNLLRGKPCLPRMEMHGIQHAQVRSILADAGADVVYAGQFDWGAPGWVNYRYCAVRRRSGRA